MAGSAKTIFTERMMKLIAFKTLNAPAKAGGFYQLMENKYDFEHLRIDGKIARSEGNHEQPAHDSRTHTRHFPGAYL
ncbi:MAG: hypothetical protein WAT12_10400 [Candidatus Nitrotoga sp.]